MPKMGPKYTSLATIKPSEDAPKPMIPWFGGEHSLPPFTKCFSPWGMYWMEHVSHDPLTWVGHPSHSGNHLNEVGIPKPSKNYEIDWWPSPKYGHRIQLFTISHITTHFVKYVPFLSRCSVIRMETNVNASQQASDSQTYRKNISSDITQSIKDHWVAHVGI